MDLILWVPGNRLVGLGHYPVHAHIMHSVVMKRREMCSRLSFVDTKRNWGHVFEERVQVVGVLS